MPIKFGNVGISGIVCANASSTLSDVSGVAITNSTGQLVGIISLPKNFTKLKSEGSRIAGFSIAGIRDDLLVPFNKSTSGEDLTFNRSDVIDFISYEPDGLVIESNEYSVDIDSNEPVNFKFYYPFNQSKFAPDRTLIASNISSLLYFLQQQDADASSTIQNAFNFNINDFINPSGDDSSVAYSEITQAVEASKRISVLVQATTATIQGVSEADCFQALATNVATETTARSGIQTFFEEKSSGIILSTIASASGLASIEELPQEIITQTINLADNINYISNKDIENYDRGNQISSLVLVQNILQQGIDLKESNTTVASTISQQVETIASGILGENYVQSCDIIISEGGSGTTSTTTSTTTTTTTTASPNDEYASQVRLQLDFEGSSLIDKSPYSVSLINNGVILDDSTYSGGTKSGRFTPVSDWGNWRSISATDASFSPGYQEFTIEAWVKHEYNSWPYHTIMSLYDGGYMRLVLTASSLNYLGAGIGWTLPPVNTWFHIAVCRWHEYENGPAPWSGPSNLVQSPVRIYVNGVDVGGRYDAYVPISSTVLRIGQQEPDNNGVLFGWMDGFRYTVGVARYKSNFTPSTIEYSINTTTTTTTTAAPTTSTTTTTTTTTSAPSGITGFTVQAVMNGVDDGYGGTYCEDGTYTYDGVTKPKYRKAGTNYYIYWINAYGMNVWAINNYGSLGIMASVFVESSAATPPTTGWYDYDNGGSPIVIQTTCS